MRHEVPQFIDIEDKIFGPLTFKQAIYLAGSGGISFFIYYFLDKIGMPLYITLVLVAPPVALGGALAFIKINDRPFIFFLESWFYFLITSKKYIWKKRDNKKKVQTNRVENQDFNNTNNFADIPKISRSKIKDIAWNLDMEQ